MSFAREPGPASPVPILRTILLTIFTLIFVACFGDLGISLYYLSALSLNSLQTAGVFTGIIVTSGVLLVTTVWGCYRAKDVRSQSHLRSKLSFNVLYISLLAIFIAWAFFTRSSALILSGVLAEPLTYWSEHPGPEANLLVNFGLEFQDMWESGECQGNDCLYSDCRGDPVATTPLICADLGMTAEFGQWITKYKGTADDLRSCDFFLDSLMNATGVVGFPKVTWCQSRFLFLQSARGVNEFMFWFLLCQILLIGFSIPLAWLHSKLVQNALRNKTGSKYFLRASTEDNRWLQSLKSEDEDLDAVKSTRNIPCGLLQQELMTYS